MTCMLGLRRYKRGPSDPHVTHQAFLWWELWRRGGAEREPSILLQGRLRAHAEGPRRDEQPVPSGSRPAPAPRTRGAVPSSTWRKAEDSSPKRGQEEEEGAATKLDRAEARSQLYDSRRGQLLASCKLLACFGLRRSCSRALSPVQDENGFLLGKAWLTCSGSKLVLPLGAALELLEEALPACDGRSPFDDEKVEAL